MTPSPTLNSTETSLLHTFQEVLGASKTEFGVDTNLLEWGVTSLELIKLKGKLKENTSLCNAISIGSILSNPTVRTLACSLANLPLGPQVYDPAVTIQSRGTGIPLWLVHPDSGECLGYLNLVRLITDRPVYALRARGLNTGESDFSSIAEARAIHYAAVKKHQPRGPYAFAGYEIGSILAFEIGKMLRDQGEEVRFIGAFNTALRREAQLIRDDWSLCLLDLALSLGLITEQYSASVLPYFPSLAKGEAVQHIHHAADPSRMVDLSLTGDILADWTDVTFSLRIMRTHYEPTGQTESIDVFYCDPPDVYKTTSSSQDWFEGHLKGWQKLSNDARFYQLDENRDGMLGPESVMAFQKTLSKVLLARGV